MGAISISVIDNQGGRITAPLASVFVVLGVCSGGTQGQFVVASGIGGPAALATACGYGPGVELAAMICNAGGTVIFGKTGTKTKGTASTVTADAGNTGLTVMTVTVDGTQGAFDDYLVVVKCVVAGTIGTSASIQVSLDAGRNYGPVINLGTATTYVISNTGVTLDFTVATIAKGDKYTFGTYAPSSDPTDGTNGGIKETLTALANSVYGRSGWGGLIIAGGKDGTQTMQGWSYSDAHLIEGYLDTLAGINVFSGAIIQSRDASPAAKWGGTAETEAAWVSSITTDYGSPNDRRLCVGAGYYNMASPFPNASAGAWVPRRCISWADACRQVAIELKTLSSRVSDGALSTIVVDPTNDPLDGFIYHDERNSATLGPGPDPANPLNKFMTGTTYVRGGASFYIDEPMLMSPFGSDFDVWPKRVVMDAACSIAYQAGLSYLNADVRLNADGTLDPREKATAEIAFKAALDIALTSTGQISQASVVVDGTTNMTVTKKLKVTITIVSRGYVMSESISIGFGVLAAA